MLQKIALKEKEITSLELMKIKNINAAKFLPLRKAEFQGLLNPAQANFGRVESDGL
jgi:hypothetical protein